MNEVELRRLMAQVADGSVKVEDAVGQLKAGPFKTGTAESVSPDYHRRLRLGMSEVVYGEFKTHEQIVTIVEKLSGAADAPVLVTRLDEDQQAALRKAFPAGRANQAVTPLPA